MLLGFSVKPAHWFMARVVHQLLDELFIIPPRAFRFVLRSLYTFVAVQLFGCLTVQLYTPNPLTLSQLFQPHLIKYNWSTDWLIHYLQRIDATKLPSLTSLYTSVIDASNFNWLLEYFVRMLSSNFHLTFILLIHSSTKYSPMHLLFITH
jgi:hypothetical protein